MFDLRPYQEIACEAIEEDWALGQRSLMLECATGLGKAQPLSSKVLTPYGFVYMGSLEVDDLVIGSDGAAHPVTGVFHQGTKQVFRVGFSDGTSTRCCEDHLWTVQTKYEKNRLKGFSTRPLKSLGALKDGTGQTRWFVPIVKPVQFLGFGKPAIDPYLFGMLLGDGSFRNGRIEFSTEDAFLFEQVNARLPERHYLKPVSKYDSLIQTNGEHGILRKSIRRFGLDGTYSHEKFIPCEYKYGSPEVRLEVLRGLMDTDGHITASDRHAEFNTTSRSLADDVCEIVRSLGGCVSVRVRPPSKYCYKGETKLGRQSYRVTVNIADNPFKLPRKADLFVAHKNQGRTKAIVSITPDGEEECQCISVDTPDHLYVTDDYILTHNTVIFGHLARRFGGRVLVVCPMNVLLAQAAAKIHAIAGSEPDIEQASLWANETEFGRSQFVVASKQTLCKQRKDGTYRYQRFRDIDLVVVDECDLAATQPCKKMLDHFREQGACVLGVTATARRNDGVAMANLFEKCSYQYGIVEAIDDGWLVSCDTRCVQVQSMDLSDVSTTAGDFSRGELNEILEQEKVILEIAEIAARESGNLKTAIYCASVAEAKGVAGVLSTRYGKRAGFVCADTKICSKDEREAVLRDFTQGDMQFMANVGIASRGWDFPGLEHIVQAQPTQSLNRFTQIFGRGTRPLGGIVDFAGSTPESRKAAIAGSAKPVFRMTDLVDNSLNHKICTTLDVLSGKMGIAHNGKQPPTAEELAAILERAKKNLQGNAEPQGASAALAQAAREIQKEKDEAEARRRANIKAEVQYRLQAVDPFDSFQRASKANRPRTGVHMLFGKYKGRPIVDVDSGYLNWMLRKCEKLPPWFKTAIEGELEVRKPKKPGKTTNRFGTPAGNFVDSA